MESFKFGLIGHNIGYSRSVDIFEIIYEVAHVKGSFENFDLAPDTFEKEFKKVVQKGINGLSVTIPYKSKVIPLLDGVTPIARALEAVNCISISQKRLHGHNTDIVGFSMPLKPYSEQLKRGNALVLGAGGSARSVIYSLHTDCEVSNFTVLGRSLEKMQNLQTSLKSSLLNSEIVTASLDQFQFKPSEKYSIAVNCTPLGGWNMPDESPLPDHFDWSNIKLYYDLNYNFGNKMVREALDHGVTALDGSQMLVAQALRAFELWTGQTVDFDDIYGRVFDRSKQSTR